MADEAPRTELDHAGHSDVGRVRDINEDSLGAEEVGPGWLFVVADGMGGHDSGEVASRIAVRTIIDTFRTSTTLDPARRLYEAMRTAHGRILARQGERAGRDRMGTTAVALYLSHGLAHYVWVGDSRIYLVRDGEISAITLDHTLGRELVERGLLDPAAVADHPDGHKLSRALGMEQQWHPERCPQPLSLEAGDMFLLCSDGLYINVSDADILGTMLAMEPVDAAIRLVERANDGGGEDNVTVQVIHVDTREAAVEAAARGGHIGSVTMELQALASGDLDGEELPLSAPAPTAQLGPVDPPPVAPPPAAPPPAAPPPAAPPPAAPPVELQDTAKVPVYRPPEEVPPPPDGDPTAESMPALEAAAPPAAPSQEASEEPVFSQEFPSDGALATASTPAAAVVAVTPDEARSAGSALRTWILLGGVLLFLLAFAAGITVAVAVLVLLPARSDARGPASAGGLEAPPEVLVEDAPEDRAGAAVAAFDQIAADDCDGQWSELRARHDELQTDPVRHEILALRTYRCYVDDARRAVEAHAAAPDDEGAREADLAIRLARRFLDPGTRADATLRTVSQLVLDGLGAAEVDVQLATLAAWEQAVR